MSTREVLRRNRYKIVPAVVAIALLTLAAVFHRSIIAWFSGEPAERGATGGALTAPAGAFTVEARLEPDPPREERNRLVLRVFEGEQPASAASVKVTYSMPAMGAMPEMRGEADVDGKGSGRYLAEFDLPMGGSWTLEVAVSKGERSGTATFSMTVGSKGLTVTGGSGAHKAAAVEPAAPSLPAHQFDEDTLERLRAAFAAYDQARALLAKDTLEGLRAQATALRAALDAAAAGVRAAPAEVSQCISQAATAAEALGQAKDVEDARLRFGEVSMYLIALASADPRLAEGLHVFKCPMTKAFPKWFQRTPRLENPYMGQQMLECGFRTEWTVTPPSDDADARAGTDEIAHYTCPMHPSVKQQAPGKCPICGMDLTPVTKQEVETSTIFVDEVRRQRIGVRTARAERRELVLSIRAVGAVKFDESRLADVNLRMSGWVENLLVDETGQRVRRGQTLFTLYSPELYAAQLEHLSAVRRQGEGAAGVFTNLVKASSNRLLLLGMTKAQIRELEQRGDALQHVPIPSPAGGYVVEKNVVSGARIEAGTRVYRIADLSRVWIDADVYESDLPHIRIGQPVMVELPYLPDHQYEGRVDYIYPTLAGQTRTARVRIVLDNPDLELKPDMYANVRFNVALGERLAIPDSAVIYTGPRRLVFVDLGEGRLRPQPVELGAYADGFYEVKKGLQPGDVVVTSGNFLIAAESRIRSAAQYWEGTDGTE